MFETFRQAFWKALTPDLVPEQAVAQARDDSVPVEAMVLAEPVLAALGGEANLKSRQRVALTRLRVELHDASRLDQAALRKAGVPGVMALRDGVVHLLMGLDSRHAEKA
ncbi:PTS transporter subunit EIIB [Pseudomonas vanderleydeniana]|uniref:PTS transporter subunit EIIB n=1 Tax=Pseudomonas vanderleydeniana TaxID=2745495 RepID=A0A9E6PJE5_9PSED|nr:PTS transporter subunit EIIB [Pseudomonas vanderleydeniana]QXI27558.1 PTS transporter subunit EIIB [Pseudomonas vanderleydeniana]